MEARFLLKTDLTGVPGRLAVGAGGGEARDDSGLGPQPGVVCELRWDAEVEGKDGSP